MKLTVFNVETFCAGMTATLIHDDELAKEAKQPWIAIYFPDALRFCSPSRNWRTNITVA